MQHVGGEIVPVDDILLNRGWVESNMLEKVVESITAKDEEVSETDMIGHSRYYNPYQPPKSLAENTSGIKILSLNTDSINAKFAQLEILIDLWGDQWLYFDVICLQESWLKSGHEQFNISWYNLTNQYTCCSEHGGLMIYVISDLKTRVLKQITDSDIWEGIFLQRTFGKSICHR